jgi:hypothetical protein
MVRVFDGNLHTRMPLVPRLEASRRVTNGILLGCLLLLPVDTVNCVQTLKAHKTNYVCLRWLFEALERLCITAQIREKVAADNVIPMVIATMKDTLPSPLVQQACCRVLARLAQTPKICADARCLGLDQNFALEDAFELHAFAPLEALSSV